MYGFRGNHPVQIKSRAALCLVFVLLLSDWNIYAADSVVYNGFAGQYQQIYVNGHKLREKEEIIIDDTAVNDMTDQFLPRDMGDGSYAFEVRSSNQPHKERQYVEVWDDYEEDWVYEYKYVDVWDGFTRRIAAAENGMPLTASKYKFGHKDMNSDATFEGMNDNTQHWIRERIPILNHPIIGAVLTTIFIWDFPMTGKS